MGYNPGLKLGELIQALERKDQEAYVDFDFVHFRPDKTVGSYRGYYEDLAIGYTDKWDGIENSTAKVGDLVKVLKLAIGREFQGYKGGHYMAAEDSTVWVANNGESGGTYIHDVETLNGSVILITKKME